jgi:zinc transporter 2
MSGIAGIGVLVNVALACILGPEHHVHLAGTSHDHHHDDHSDHHHQHQDADGDDDDNDHQNQHNHTYDHMHNRSNCAGHDSTKKSSSLEDVQNQSNEKQHIHTYPHERSSLLCQSISTTSGHLHADEVDSTGDVEQNHAPKTKTSSVARNVNLHAAYIHVLGDLTQSVVVFMAGLIIWWKPSWTMVDPIATLLFCTLVFYSTLGVMRSCIAILLEEVPPHVDWKAVHRDICRVEHVRQVHDLHIWSISHNIPVLSVHCFVDDNTVDSARVLRDIDAVCQRYGIRHSTIQIQCGTLGECITCHREHEDKCAAPSLAAASPGLNAQVGHSNTLDNNHNDPRDLLHLSI